jgi:hypothetical protein
MVMSQGRDPERSRMGWQGDGVDVEVETVQYGHAWRYRWSLYHHARLIKTGMRRSRWGAEIVANVAVWWYRWSVL